MGDCSEGSDNLTPVISTITHTDKSNEMHKSNKVVHFSTNNGKKKITADNARTRVDQNLKGNVLGFALGVLASMFIAIGTSCTQVL